MNENDAWRTQRKLDLERTFKLQRDSLYAVYYEKTEHVEDFAPGMVSPCRLWRGSLDHNGYGQLAIRIVLENGEKKRITLTAHRFALLFFRGEFPSEIGHLCHQRACCAVDHLESTTRKENVRAVIARGLHVGSQKLRAQDVEKIRAELAVGKSRQMLANEYGVTRRAIGHISTGTTWGPRT